MQNLCGYLRKYSDCLDARRAYENHLAEDGLVAGQGGVASYSDVLHGSPKVCIKVPTGGGKTFIAANALFPVFEELPETPADVVVWLVPRKEILRQTLRQLRDSASALRMTIDRDFAHCVEVLDKEDGLRGRGFTRTTVEDQLTIFVLSYDSFKNKDGRRAYAENASLSQLTEYQKETGQYVDVDGADDTALISALAGTNPVVIVDESHHAGSKLSIDMLRNLNPRFVLELTATPGKDANVISRVKSTELKAEEMVKLPVIVYRRQDKKSVIQDAFLLQQQLENIAKHSEKKSGRYIRPIVLFQAERRGDNEAETFEKLKSRLIDAGIPEEQIAVRTGSVDELGDTDLMSRACPIRFVITVEALAEGWDCPFAYILATVANKSSKVSVEQLVGRILRQPYATRYPERSLNISYVLTSSADFNQTVDQVIEGLNGAGFSKHDVVEGEVTVRPILRPIQPSLEQAYRALDDDFELTLSEFDGGMAEQMGGLAVPKSISAIVVNAENLERDFESKVVEEQAHTSNSTTGVGGEKNMYAIQASLVDSVNRLLLPQFRYHQRAGLFSDEETLPFDRKMLLQNFNLASCGTGCVNIDSSGFEGAREVDIYDDSGELRVKQLGVQQSADLRSLFARYTQTSKRSEMCNGIINCMSIQFQNTYGDKGLKNFVSRVVDQMDDSQVDAYIDNASRYAKAIVEAISQLSANHCREQFEKQIDSGLITLECCYQFPLRILQTNPLTIYDHSLYEAEDANLTEIERKMAETLANCETIRWWHRVVERKEGEFFINGFINHYPDFLAMTQGGLILAIETKGEQLKNDDSRAKLDLGTRWAMMAGSNYRYFMVFDHDAIDASSSYTLAEFKTQILGLMR
ncbi:MAG TPA: DEAD/DEAH box helicase family protein [Candidatus Gordonibacter avicola]|nr:DEAD/DEAH box helicase family protein [Candidatus Gordonibacter avicola]